MTVDRFFECWFDVWPKAIYKAVSWVVFVVVIGPIAVLGFVCHAISSCAVAGFMVGWNASKDRSKAGGY